MRAIRRLTLLAVMGLAACPGPGEGPDLELETLVGWMVGSFSSAAQAAEDPAFFDIRLEMVPIWTEREDGRWLYVEQARAGALDRPYRQRIYRVDRGTDGAFVSEVYAFADPSPYVGGHRTPRETFEALEPDALVRRRGCAVHLRRRADGAYVGATRGQGCESSLAGAAYATSEVEVHVDRILSWDRGFDDAGNQVWGAEKGGYVFRRASD